MSKNPNPNRPNGKKWKRTWAGNPPEEVMLEARVQSAKMRKVKVKQ